MSFSWDWWRSQPRRRTGSDPVSNSLLFQSTLICDNVRICKHGNIHALLHALPGIGILKSGKFLQLQVDGGTSIC
jgi:hypothetical protein